ncbi:uncharacterized protein TrAFT101_006857 [Trichoderma asperellum]|uniref:uncharacterized protein n=1 Tax=Trichoderma asperellum TaxID=101201 RepID=UPI0033319648|nr:hypothetical protein TrAFT101_006857 [Trichoderma asperellum]
MVPVAAGLALPGPGMLSSAQRPAAPPDPAFFRHRSAGRTAAALLAWGSPRKPQLVVTASQLEPASPASP